MHSPLIRSQSHPSALTSGRMGSFWSRCGKGFLGIKSFSPRKESELPSLPQCYPPPCHNCSLLPFHAFSLNHSCGSHTHIVPHSLPPPYTNASPQPPIYCASLLLHKVHHLTRSSMDEGSVYKGALLQVLHQVPLGNISFILHRHRISSVELTPQPH